MTLRTDTQTGRTEWDAFLTAQHFSPFLQSFAMGDVYAGIGQTPIRIALKENDRIVGVCFGHIVDARRGKHLSIPYGPVLADDVDRTGALRVLIDSLRTEAMKHQCTFIRLSPFWPEKDQNLLFAIGAKRSVLHLLAEYVWFLDLNGKTEEQILMNMRKTTRNLIRRAEKEGVTVRASTDPISDLHHFIRLHDETRARHGFTPYTNAFFKAQVEQFAKENACTLYLAEYQSQIIAASIHMHFGSETSYHHGASSGAFAKIPASYLLQWTAIRDAMKRGDNMYNFWGIAPLEADGTAQKGHPFAGVTLFKTGFGGELLPLTHCVDIPLTSRYYFTRGFELLRKWRRGF